VRRVTPEHLFGTWDDATGDAVVLAGDDLVRHGQAATTRQKREFALARFDEFCSEERLPNLPAGVNTIVAFLNALPDSRSYSSLEGFVMAIRDRQLAAGLDDPLTPALAQALVGFKRERSGRVRHTYALEADQVRALVETIRNLPMVRDDQIIHLCRLRDIALILLTFSKNLLFCHARVLLRVQLMLQPRAIVIRCRDEIGRDLFVGPGRDPLTCPVAALRRYLRARTDASPYVFAPHRFDRGQPLGTTVFTTALHRYARAAGIPPRLFSPTSLRRGAARAAAAANADLGQTLSNLGILNVVTLQKLTNTRRSPAF
jgi:integrase